MEQETIVAIATPPGRGGIGIVRISGPEARSIAEPMLHLRAPMEPGRARFGDLLDEDGSRLDEVVTTYFAAPHSYTSDDVVEIAAHGSPVVLEMILRRAIAAGARLARPGEFTERAFLSGRLDLTQAEAVRDLIEAQTLHQARVAAQQLGGALAERVRPVKDALVKLIAALEAGIDFAEDDVDVMPQQAILDALKAVHAPLVELAASYAQGRLVREGVTMAIVGRPNAGKSSLFNRLVERERAIVTAAAGTTRDLVTERVSLGGIPVELVDTAGIRESSDEAESIGIRKTREAMADADLVLLVLDATQTLTDEERAWMEELQQREAIVVWNKIDIAATAGEGIEVSALTGEGIGDLRDLLLAKLKTGAVTSETAMLTNLRQQHAVQQAIDGLDAAVTAAGAGIPHEMVLLDIYGALRGLDELTGATTADDVLNLIFSSFCIGK
ncbi:tRNA uridine-5-carboxymethylaminomethyl(34) synthesis GTPase MnmE [Terriglobus sp. 2YAB30_2]|uniref:tRNA uridine-5-carboxymethylaminomethyl(34) synthesis GTPase MnmE n=3 Tax=unclassified Terriglobus TaxID=2628988 RepID=UPI003F97B5C5